MGHAYHNPNSHTGLGLGLRSGRVYHEGSPVHRRHLLKMPGDTLLDRETAIQCQTFRQAEAATAVYNEAMLLVRSYRACLEKYEEVPTRAREYCAQYPKALQEIGLQIKEQPESSPRAEASTAKSP